MTGDRGHEPEERLEDVGVSVVEHDTSTPWRRGIPELWPEPGPDLAIVDPEWDRDAFPHLPVPAKAVLGWVRAPGSDEYRPNPGHLPGPRWLGWPAPLTPADKIIDYDLCGWLDDPVLYSGYLDVVVYCPEVADTHAVAEDGGRRYVRAYSSLARLPGRSVRWIEVGVRELLQVMDADEVRVNPGSPWHAVLEKEIVGSLDRWPAPFALPPARRDVLPEHTNWWRDTTTDALVADGRPPYVTKTIRNRICEIRESALDNGFALDLHDVETITAMYLWEYTERQGPPPPGARRLWRVRGEQYQPGTLGKAWPGLREDQPHGWVWLVGAFVGFAWGEEAAGGDGTLTAGLLHLAEHMADRGSGRHGRVERLHAPWFADFAPYAEPVPEVVALVGAAASGDPVLAGPLWDDRISPVFDRVLSRTHHSRAPQVALADLGLFPEILALRDQREVPLAAQLTTLATPWERALLIATKRGHHPTTATPAAPDPLTGALLGALLGAWHGIPRLGVTPRLGDAAEDVASVLYSIYHPDNAVESG
ncbi:hypothetical protein SUDANB95_02546 [Actinosynnema sp. ALI-1.44]